MNAETNNQQPCNCELCQPNWHLGRSDEDFETQPTVAPARRVTLEDEHMAKVMATQLAAAN